MENTNTELNIKIRPRRSADTRFIVSMVPPLTNLGPLGRRDKQTLIATDIEVLTGKLSNATFETAIFIAEDEQETKPASLFDFT